MAKSRRQLGKRCTEDSIAINCAQLRSIALGRSRRQTLSNFQLVQKCRSPGLRAAKPLDLTNKERGFAKYERNCFSYQSDSFHRSRGSAAERRGAISPRR